jgi:predicted Zn finger-like uncharacterized protein
MPYTRCPACATGFRISAAQLAAAAGQVRCGRCGSKFDALAALSDDPLELAPRPRSQAPRPNPPAEQQSPGPLILRPSEEPEPATREQEDEPEPPRLAEAEVAPSPFPEGLADFAASYTDHAAPPGNTRRRLLVGGAKGLGMLTLGVILLLQLTWFEREQVVYTPAGRSLLNGLCWVTGCEPPPRRDLGRLEIESREILAREQQPGVLHLRLEFVNQAGFPQPYPWIRVTLLSQQREPTAQRTFSPGEYLAPGASPSYLVRPQEKVQVRLELMKPETGWTGQYRFEFL